MEKKAQAETYHLKPAPGLNIRDPKTGAVLKAEGETKPASTFWRRRLADGDVIECKPAVKAAEAKLKAEPKKEESKGIKENNGGKQ